MPLVVDCCSLVHAKAMRGLEHPPLDLLGSLAARGAGLVCTPAVRGELEASSLRETLAGWRSRGLIVEEQPRLTERKEVLNQLRRSDCQPGRNDVGLVVIARRLRAPLLTHDAAASVLAMRCGVMVLDLADVAVWAVRAGVCTLAEVNSAWGSLTGYPWPGPSGPLWLGSLEKTVDVRPKLGQVLDELMAWLA